MDPNAPESLFEALRKSGQYTPDQLAALPDAPMAAGPDLYALADQLLAGNILTTYQVRKVRANRIGELVVGPYLVLDKIGEGGMGKVYKAVQTSTGRAVALKVVRAHLMTNKVVRARYRREAEAAAALNHPNIVALLDADDAQGRYFLAMEYVEGSDLARMVRELGPLPYSEACEYIRQTALGLQHAHERSLIHRDVKPSNLLVSGERALPGTSGKATVKILDMGLVRSLADEDVERSELTRDGTVVGTPDYMAPEQAKNSSTVDHRADLYSLGCTLFMVLAGRPPFPDGTPIDKLLRHQLDHPPNLLELVHDIPIGLAAIAERLMAKRPADRFASASELAAALYTYTPEATRAAAVAAAAAAAASQRRRQARDERSRKASVNSSASAPASVIPSGPVAVVAQTAADSPPALPRSKTPVVIVRRIENPNSSDSMTIPTGDAEPLDAELVDDGTAETPPVRRDPRPRKPQRRTQRAPDPPVSRLLLWGALIVGGSILLGLAIAVAVRSIRTNDPANQPSRTGEPAITRPTAVAPDPLQPVAVNLPNDTTACAVLHLRPYWKQAAAAIKPDSRFAGMLRDLQTTFGVDARECDRITLAFPTGRAGWSLFVAEGGPAAPNWVAEREKDGKAKPEVIEGLTVLAFPPAGDPVYGSRPGNSVVLGPDRETVVAVTRRASEKKAATGIPPHVLAALPDPADPAAPAITFASSGGFALPEIGPLTRHGIERVEARIRLTADGFDVEVFLTGASREKIIDFVSLVLGTRLTTKYPHIRPFVVPIIQSDGQSFETRDGLERMRLSGKWDFNEFHDWIEKLIPSGKGE